MMRQLIIFASLLLIFSLPPSSKGYQLIESPAQTNWGDWGVWSRCPFGRHTQAIQIRTEPYQGVFGDDTAANGIRLYCGDPYSTNTMYITSNVSEWGNWGNVRSCRSDDRPISPDGYIVGFQLRVESYYPGDNTATNNFRIHCYYPSLGTDDWKEGDGLTYGSWTAQTSCNVTREGICGLQTQIEPYQGSSADDTALNNIRAECCDR